MVFKRSDTKGKAIMYAEELASLGYDKKEIISALGGKYLYSQPEATHIANSAIWRNKHKGQLSPLEQTNTEIQEERKEGIDSRGYKVDKEGVIEEE